MILHIWYRATSLKKGQHTIIFAASKAFSGYEAITYISRLELAFIDTPWPFLPVKTCILANMFI